MTFIIHANTPEEFRTELVSWLRRTAGHYNDHKVLLTTRMRERNQARDFAVAYSDAANFIEKIEIKEKVTC